MLDFDPGYLASFSRQVNPTDIRWPYVAHCGLIPKWRGQGGAKTSE